MAKRDQYLVVMLNKEGHMIRESPKWRHSYNAGRWVRSQPEWYASKTRNHDTADIWTSDDYTYRLVTLYA